MSWISVILILGGHLIKFQAKFFFTVYWNIYGFSGALQFASAQSCQESGNEFSRRVWVCVCMRALIEEGWVDRVGEERGKKKATGEGWYIWLHLRSDSCLPWLNALQELKGAVGIVTNQGRQWKMWVGLMTIWVVVNEILWGQSSKSQLKHPLI